MKLVLYIAGERIMDWTIALAIRKKNQSFEEYVSIREKEIQMKIGLKRVEEPELFMKPGPVQFTIEEVKASQQPKDVRYEFLKPRAKQKPNNDPMKRIPDYIKTARIIRPDKSNDPGEEWRKGGYSNPDFTSMRIAQ